MLCLSLLVVIHPVLFLPRPPVSLPLLLSCDHHHRSPGSHCLFNSPAVHTYLSVDFRRHCRRPHHMEGNIHIGLNVMNRCDIQLQCQYAIHEIPLVDQLIMIRVHALGNRL